MDRRPSSRVILGCLFAALLASRLCHVGILWAEENLPLAAAVEMLHGKTLYRDAWFDKPPLVPGIYLLWGAETGWILRLAGALYAFLGCVLLYCFGRDLWGRREGVTAACLLGFFLIFGIPSAVMPLAADSLMIVPHIAAVYLAWRGRPFWSGVLAGVAFLFNSKALFVAAACVLMAPSSILLIGAGFLLPNAAALAGLSLTGALPSYWQQVWQWGMLYSANTFVDQPLRNGILRTLNWAGFHAALVLGMAVWLWRGHDPIRWRFAGWAALSLVAVAAGWRFFPRYYFQLLPVCVLAAAHGFYRLPRWRVWVLAALLAIPAVRFGPRYFELALDLATGQAHDWRDLAMDEDSQDVSAMVRQMASPNQTLFIWGYRPEIYAYTRMPAGTRFLESQPLTGVFADRHLAQSEPLALDLTRAHRVELARTRPDFVLDGLGLYNPALALTAYPDLAPWLAQYREVARTRATVVYRLR